MTSTWPTARLDAVQRLRVLSETLRAPLYAEAHFAEPPADVWSVAADLPNHLPQWIRTMRSFEFVDGTAAPLRAVAVGRLGHRAVFDVALETGWCLMQSPSVIGGMAAVPDGDGTRFAVLGGTRGRLRRTRRLVFLPLAGTSARRMVGNLARLLDERATGSAQTG
ncbi:hypothetical protein ACFO1B_31925 [Dactylosporangium siamense]|uniref:Polyketide cyclase / dehydrase and lipid transport n=1 Tax=Dactylosporangium siamense TaxID=685454 RepID=A0A919PPP8_9ACTN|nr:hypothetical protein [Dactylosporangium siamense]GIG48630.1 hypothetical protein Dsi01nite_066710 [Dactylosporangium siamense]